MKERNKEHVQLKKAIRVWGENSNFYKFMDAELMSEKKTGENISKLKCDHYENVKQIYALKVESAERRLEEMVDFDRKFEEHLALLPVDYQKIIRRYYKNRENVENICMDMFVSRATYFRMMQKANDLLIAAMKESGFWAEVEKLK